MTKLMAYGFVLVTILFTVVGQLLIKWQAMQAGNLPAGWHARASFMMNLLLNPWIILGLLSAVVAACAWMLAMTRLPISIAYPMMSLTYPLVIVASWLLLGETLSLWRAVGVIFILAGIALLGVE
jgi:multidrug transporter EmrE-like cation transporter